jgi:putative FmdB family regulatory protein
MPNYAYKCEKCEHSFDEMLKYEDRDLPTTKPCPSCNKKKIIRDWAASAPSLAMDATLTPSKVVGSQFKEVIDKIKSSGQVPKRLHGKLDASANMNAGRIVR